MPSAKGKDKSSKPDYLQRCVADLVDQGKDLSAAFAICTSTMQKAGYLTKGAGMKQTEKGAKRAAEFAKQPDNKGKLAKYEKAVKAGRKTESVLGRLASELSNQLSMTEAVDVPSGPKDWALDTDESGSREVAYALTKAAKKAQEYIEREVKKAGEMGEDEAIALTRKAKKEICLPVHKLHSDYGATDRDAVDALDSFLADVAGEATGLDKRSIYLSL
jgi:hypothetical protein